MAIEFKRNSSRETLYQIAVGKGIAVAAEADRPTIIAALDAYNVTNPEPEAAAEGVQDGTGGEKAPEGTGDTLTDETTAQGAQDGTGGEKAPEGTGDTLTDETTAQGAQDGTGAPEAPGATKDTPATKSAAQGSAAAENSEHVSFAYAGPSLPHGRLKENAVFRGKIGDVLNYLADVLEDYPQVEKLIVPTTRLAAFRAKVKTPGNIAHKYFNDIVSAMRGNKEV